MTGISKSRRMKLWNYYIGLNIGSIECTTCDRDIKVNKIYQLDFEAAHVLPKCRGGSIEIKNLRPCCRDCNALMGTQNMRSFVKKRKKAYVIPFKNVKKFKKRLLKQVFKK